MKVLLNFRLRAINKLLQYTGLRLAVMYDTNDVGEIVQGTPVRMAIVWWGWKDFIPLIGS